MCLVAVVGRDAGCRRPDVTRAPESPGRPVTRINLNFAEPDVHYGHILPSRPRKPVGGASSGPVRPVQGGMKRPFARSGWPVARISDALKRERRSTAFMSDQPAAFPIGEHGLVAER